MNVLFERYVGMLARRILRTKGLRVSLQGPQRYLANSTTGDPSFSLRPDIVVFERDAVRLVIDTKWKRLKQETARESVASSDMYQMYAYVRRYFAPQVVLLYPHHPELGDWLPERASYTTQESAGTIASRISVATVELRDLGCVPSQLLAITELAAHAASTREDPERERRAACLPALS
jgi:5-methylcytosine-specific restriction enzyme subunit McrC